MLAVVGSKPPGQSGNADQVFAQFLDEARQSGQSLAVSVKHFALQK